MTILRSTLYYIGISLMTIFIVITGPLYLPFPYKYRYHHMTRFARFAIWWLGVTCGLRYRVSGEENIPEGAAVLLSKHQSAWETIAFQQIFPPQTWVLKESLFKLPFFGWGLKLMLAIGIDRNAGKKALKQVVEQGTDRLRKGLWVVVFPEGTRMSPGQRGRYAIGGSMLAEKAGVPVVPVAHNAGELWPKNSMLKHPGVIDVVIGPPIATAGRKASAINAEAEEWIESTMQTITHTPAAQ